MHNKLKNGVLDLRATQNFLHPSFLRQYAFARIQLCTNPPQMSSSLFKCTTNIQAYFDCVVTWLSVQFMITESLALSQTLFHRQTTTMSPRRQQDLYMYNFHDASHPDVMLDAWRGFYSDGLFTDTDLWCSSGQVLHCHKVMLYACSSFFRVMFTAYMKERTNSLVWYV